MKVAVKENPASQARETGINQTNPSIPFFVDDAEAVSGLENIRALKILFREFIPEPSKGRGGLRAASPSREEEAFQALDALEKLHGLVPVIFSCLLEAEKSLNAYLEISRGDQA